MRTLALLLLIAWVSAGCQTAAQQRATARSEQRAQQLRNDVYRLQEQMAGVTQAQERLFEALEALRGEVRAGRHDADKALAESEAVLRKTEAMIEAARRQIVSQLSRNVATVLEEHAAPPPETGREHLVRAGETLSEIAVAYGVTVKAIVRANGLPNADSIYAGQTLFIPD